MMVSDPAGEVLGVVLGVLGSFFGVSSVQRLSGTEVGLTGSGFAALLELASS